MKDVFHNSQRAFIENSLEGESLTLIEVASSKDKSILIRLSLDILRGFRNS